MGKTYTKVICGIMLYVFLGGYESLKAQVTVTYIANCGFLYQTEKARVLIDPFGTEYGNYFYLPDTTTRQNITNGNAAFKNIDLVLITHIHGDHFNAKLAERFLLKHHKAKMICPQQVYNQMKDSCPNFKTIAARLFSPAINMNEACRTTLNNIPVNIIRMQHGSDRNLDSISYSHYTDYEKTENFGYVIQLKNKHIFHQGDACLKINKKALSKIDVPIDIAHLGYFDWDETSYSILKAGLKARNVIFMHGTIPAKEFQTEQLMKIKPNLIIFKQELDSQSF
jgi:L-ascorbate metabolism protein UlaG (beta-lactamase superfamily)